MSYYIFSCINDQYKIPKGAVEICSSGIIQDYKRTGRVVFVESIAPNKNQNNILFRIKLMIMFLACCFKSKNIVLIYPTIPFFPSTSNLKLIVSMVIYRCFFLCLRIFKTTLIIHILDFPIEQSKCFNLRNIKSNTAGLYYFERYLFMISDLIVTYSKGFSELLKKKIQTNSNNIITLDFSPVKKGKPQNNTDIMLKTVNRIKNYQSVVFYSGELSRKFEMSILSELMNTIDYKYCLVICGNNGEWIKHIKKSNVFYLGYVDTNVHDYIASMCDFGLILYPNEGYYKITPSTKLSSYINSSIPVLAIQTDANKGLFQRYTMGECVTESEIVRKVIEWCETRKYLLYLEGVQKVMSFINSSSNVKDILKGIDKVTKK